MDNVTLIRIVAGVLAVVVLIILIFRMKKKAPLKWRGTGEGETFPVPAMLGVGCDSFALKTSQARAKTCDYCGRSWYVRCRKWWSCCGSASRFKTGEVRPTLRNRVGQLSPSTSLPDRKLSGVENHPSRAMDRSLREHISHLKQRLQDLSQQSRTIRRTQIERTRLEYEVRVAQLALTYTVKLWNWNSNSAKSRRFLLFLSPLQVLAAIDLHYIVLSPVSGKKFVSKKQVLCLFRVRRRKR